MLRPETGKSAATPQGEARLDSDSLTRPRYIGAMYRVKVEDDEIVVTNPTNDWFVSYRRTLGIKGLRVTDVVTDRKAKVSDRAAFLGEAFSKATLRARKLGWV